jgi:hypothetical protein
MERTPYEIDLAHRTASLEYEAAQDKAEFWRRARTALEGPDPTLLRDLLAAFALAGTIAHSDRAHDNPAIAAEWAYGHADAMLAARAKPA